MIKNNSSKKGRIKKEKIKTKTVVSMSTNTTKGFDSNLVRKL